MAAIPYMPLYVADYMADAGHLSTTEHGAYLLLIMSYWQRGGAFRAPDEQALNIRLANVVRMSNGEWLRAVPVLAEFFQVSLEDGVTWSHKRIEAELAKFRAKSLQAKEAGLASAQRRLNARSTPVQQASNHTDTDTDKDKTPKAPLPKKRQRDPDESRGQRFTGPATLAECPAEWAALCKGLGWPFGRACIEYQNFVDYWSSVPGAKGRKLDWLATWRVRCRDQNKKNPAKPAYEPLPPVKFWVDDLLDPK